MVWEDFGFSSQTLSGPGASGVLIETHAAKEAKKRFILSGKTPRLSGITGTGRGLQCGLSGNQAPF